MLFGMQLWRHDEANNQHHTSERVSVDHHSSTVHLREQDRSRIWTLRALD